MKLFVVVRLDLSNSQRSVQAGHAIAEFMLHRPNSSWKNHTLVILGVDNKDRLEQVIDRLDMKGIDWIGFREPDLNNEITAIASDIDCGVFRKMKLL